MVKKPSGDATYGDRDRLSACGTDVEALYVVGEKAVRDGEILLARRAFERVLSLRWPTELGDPPPDVHVALALTRLGLVSDSSGGYAVAGLRYRQAEQVWRGLATLAHARGDAARTAQLLAEAKRAAEAATRVEQRSGRTAVKTQRLADLDRRSRRGLGSIGPA